MSEYSQWFLHSRRLGFRWFLLCLSLILATHLFSQEKELPSAQSKSETIMVTLDFDELVDDPFIDSNAYAEFGIFLEHQGFHISRASNCNTGTSIREITYTGGRSVMNIPGGFKSLTLKYAAIKPPPDSCGLHRSGMSIYSGENGQGTELQDLEFTGHLSNGVVGLGGCSYDVWDDGGLEALNGHTARSVVFWETPHPCLEAVYPWTGIDNLQFEMLSGGNSFVVDAPAPYGEFDVPEGSSSDFFVKLEQELLPGQSIDVIVEKTGGPSQSVLSIPENTHTFNHSNWNQDWRVTVEAEENDGSDITNDKATYTVRVTQSQPIIDIVPVEIKIEEIDDDFQMNIKADVAVGASPPIGGVVFPTVTSEYFDIDQADSWAFEILAVPDQGYEVLDWTTPNVSATPENINLDRMGEILLSDPEVLSDDSVRRFIESLALDPDGNNHINIVVHFTDIPNVSVTVGVGSGSGSTSPSGTLSLEPNITHPISAEPEPGFVFDQWRITSGTGTIASPMSASTTLTPETNCTVEASFLAIQGTNSVTMTASPTSGGITNPSGTTVLQPGQTLTVNATPNSGWSFDRWQISGPIAFVTGSIVTPSAQVLANGPGTMTAIFTQGNVNLTMGATPNNGGSVSPSGTVSLSSGGTQTIQAFPNSGWTFNGWQTTGSVSFVSGSTTSPSAEVRVTGNATVTALFSQEGVSGRLVITPRNPSVDEGGPARTMTITLDAPPVGYHTFVLRYDFSQNSLIRINGRSPAAGHYNLTFSPADWPKQYVYSVEALEDNNERNGYMRLRLTNTSNDPEYGTEIINISENDSEGQGRIIVTPNEINVPEGVFSCDVGAFFTVRLPHRPDQFPYPVSLERAQGALDYGIYNCNGTSGVDTQQRSIKFTEENWQSGIHLAVQNEKGQREDIQKNFYFRDRGFLREFSDSPVVTVNFRNDPQGDNARITVNTESLLIPEGGSRTVEVTLHDPPPETVRFSTNLTGDSAHFNRSHTIFTLSESNPTYVITVESEEDDSDIPHMATMTLRSLSAPYGYIEPVRISLIEEDNDSERPTVIAVPGSVTMEAGLTEQVLISLAHPPEVPTVLALSTTATVGTPGIAVQTPGNRQLTFDATNYSVPQPVRLFANAEGSGTLDVTLFSGDERTQGASIPVNVTTPTVRIQTDPTGLSFGNNSSQSFSVWLSAPPPADMSLQVTARDTNGFPGIEISSPNPAVLTFTRENYANPQSVNVTGEHFGDGEVTVAWLAGEPELPSVTLPVSVSNTACSGRVTATPDHISVQEGETGVFEVRQTNSANRSKLLEIVQTLGDSDALEFLEERFTVPHNQPYFVQFTALRDLDFQDEALRFTVRDVEPSSPPCLLSDETVLIDITDSDYQLTLAVNPQVEGLTTLPAPDQTVAVDSTTFTVENPYPLAAFTTGGYIFESWSGDSQLLVSLPGSPYASPIEDPFAGIVNSGGGYQSQVHLVANFREIDPDVDEEIDAIVDELLAELEIQCGLGGSDFHEFGLESGNQTGAMTGGRILPHSGQELRDETDLVLPGLDHPTQLKLTRRHMTRVNAQRSPFGPAWFFNYRIYFTRSGDGDILLHNLGRTDLFERDAVIAEAWQGTGGRFGRMERESLNTIIMRAPSGVKWEFLSIRHASDELFRGVLQKIISPNGNEIRFEYEDAAIPLLDRRMTRIIDAYGRPIDLIYGSDGNAPYVTEIRDNTDPAAIRIWRYDYDAKGRLTSVHTPAVTSTNGFNDFPNGKRTDYSYHDHADARLTHALTGIVYPNQTSVGQTHQRYQWTYFDQNPTQAFFGYVKTHTVGNPSAPAHLKSGGHFEYSYQPMIHQGGIDEVSMCTTVTDRSGTKTALDYNRRGLLLEERIEKPVTSSNKNGPTHFKRSFSFNTSGDLQTSKTPIQLAQTAPSGFREEHPDPTVTPRHMQRQERRRILVADERGGQHSEIVTEVRYEPIFNKVFSQVDPRGLGENPELEANRVTTYQFYDYMENLSAAITLYAPQLGMTEAALTDQFIQAGIPQAIQLKWGVDPLNGGVIDINDDGRTFQDYCGNLIRRDLPDATLANEALDLGLGLIQTAFERYEYNRFGQMTRHVDAEGNHHIWEFYPHTDPNGWSGALGSADHNAGGGFLASTIRDAAHDLQANSGSAAGPQQLTTHYAYGAQDLYPRNSRGLATAVTDGRGVISRKLINELDQVVVEQAAWHVPQGDPDLQALRYLQRQRYDANGNVFQSSVWNTGSLNHHANFITNSFIFDILDQPVRTIMDSINDGLALTTLNVYDANQNLIRKTSAAGTPDASVQEWQYDARDLLMSTTKGVGGDPTIGEAATFTYEYDDNGNRIRAIDADGDVTHYQYDGLDRLNRTEDRLGNVTLTRFDAASHTTSVENYGLTGFDSGIVLLSKTDQTYDERGRAYETLQHLFHYDGLSFGSLDPGANGNFTSANSALVRTEKIFDRLGRAIATVDADGDLFKTEYNGLGGVFRTVDPHGNLVAHEYDPNHNLVRITETEIDPDGQLIDEQFITEFRYDAINRRTSVREPNGQTTGMVYDSRNNVVRTVDALQNQTEFHFDALNRKLAEIRYLSASGEQAGPDTNSGSITLRSEWDAMNRLAAQIDDAGNRTEYEYDDLNRKIAINYPEGFGESSIYNGDGERVRAETMAGTILTWQYDAAGRPLEMQVDHSMVAGDFSFEGTTLKRWAYDGLNRMIFSYDDNGTLSNSSLDSEVGVYHYFDSLGRPLAELQALGDFEGNDPTVRGKFTMSEWQGSQRLVGLTYPNGRRITRSYDALDRLSEIREASGAMIAAFEYMGPRRDLSIRYGNGTILSKRDPVASTTLGYGYDQNRRSLEHTWVRESDGALITAYRDTYNGLDGVGSNRVIAQYRDHLSRGDQWTLDSRYRIIDFQRNDGALASWRTLNGSDAMLATFIDEGFHQNPLPDGELHDYFYFDSQPRFHDANGNLRSDGVHQLVFDYANRLTSVRDNQKGEVIARYSYTANNRRVAKTFNGDKTRYLYTGWQVAEERDSLDDVLRQYVDGRGLDDHLQMMDYTLSGDGSPTPFYYHCNAQGFVGALTDDQGAVVEYAEYSLLGRPTLLDAAGAPLINNVSSVGNPYLFQGRRYDPETERYYFRNRYYDPFTGNFMTQDPSGRWHHGQGNGYSAFDADPWNNGDPMGTETVPNEACAQLLSILALLADNFRGNARYDHLAQFGTPGAGAMTAADILAYQQWLWSPSISSPAMASELAQLRYGNMRMFGQNPRAEFFAGLMTTGSGWIPPGHEHFMREMTTGRNLPGGPLTVGGEPPHAFYGGRTVGDLATMFGPRAILASARAPGPGASRPYSGLMNRTAQAIHSRNMTQRPPQPPPRPAPGMTNPRVNLNQQPPPQSLSSRALAMFGRVMSVIDYYWPF